MEVLVSRVAKVLALSLAFLGFTLMTRGAEPAGKSAQLDVPGGEGVEVTAPENWLIDRQPPNMSRPPTVMLHPANSAANLQITFMPVKDGNLATQEQVDQTVKSAAEHFVGGSVEKEIRLKDLKSKAGLSAIAEFTDAEWVGKTPPAGEYKVIGTGLVRLGQTVAAFTILGNAFDDADYVAAKGVLVNGLSVSKK